MVTVTLTKEEVIPLLRLYVKAHDEGLEFSISEINAINAAVKKLKGPFVPTSMVTNIAELKVWLETQ